MPVIVIGADVPGGEKLVERLLAREGQVRVFVSDATAAARFRSLGAKVATGDVSDATHVEAACTRCFGAVLMTAAASDNRERSFAADPPAVIDGWRHALTETSVQRAIWVSEGDIEPATPEHIVVAASRHSEDALAELIATYDEREVL